MRKFKKNTYICKLNNVRIFLSHSHYFNNTND